MRWQPAWSERVCNDNFLAIYSRTRCCSSVFGQNMDAQNVRAMVAENLRSEQMIVGH